MTPVSPKIVPPRQPPTSPTVGPGTKRVPASPILGPANKKYTVSPTLQPIGSSRYPTSPTLAPILDSSPLSTSLEKPGNFHHRQTLTPPPPPSSTGWSPRTSPELIHANPVSNQQSSRGSPVDPPISYIWSTESPQAPLSELVLPQPALPYVVATL